ncbi:MAG: hypothetical protein J5933_06020 [Clostridia bacterium]|nr:hypothetical protein [Clostridia bacterium]
MNAKRIIAVLLTVMIILVGVCSCSGSVTTPDSTVASDNRAEETTESTAAIDDDGWKEIKDDLPDDLTFGATDFTILLRDTSPYREEFDSDTQGSILDSAVMRRNMIVEDRLNISLVFDEQFGDYSQYQNFNLLINKSVNAGDQTWDAVAAYAAGIIAEGINGSFANLHSVNYLNLEKPYWNPSVNEQFTIAGKLFYITGDISPQLIGQSIVFFENLKLAEDLNVENIYSLVKEKEWTHEKLLSIIKNVYSDKNGNNIKDKEDLWGLTCPLNSQVDAFHASYNVPINRKNASGELEFAFEEEAVIKLYDRVHELLVDCEGTWAKSDYANDVATDYLAHFAADGALFTVNRLYTVTTDLTDMTSNYAILPYPMADKDQSEYITYAWNQYTMISIPRDISSFDKSGAVIEALASASQNVVTPAYYELALKSRYSRDAESSQMIDIITSNIRIEYLFLQSNVIFFIRNHIKSGTTSIASQYKAASKTYQKTFQTILKNY